MTPKPSSPDLQVLQERLLAHLQALVRERDPYWAAAGHRYVQTYFQEQWSQWGEVSAHRFEVRGQIHHNWVLDLPAHPSAASAKPLVLVGAHYDSYPGCPGADDNATGMAVLLEMARSLAAHPARHPVRLVAFDLEEYGLLGSHAYAQALQQQGQRLRLMLSLEMLGYCTDAPHSQTYPPGLKYFYPHQGNFLALVGNWKTIPDMLRLSGLVSRVGGVPCWWLPAGDRGLLVPDTRRSDHAPFWDLGYPAMMATDTANLRNPHYHKEGDRLDTLNLPFLTKVCWGLIHGIRAL